MIFQSKQKRDCRLKSKCPVENGTEFLLGPGIYTAPMVSDHFYDHFVLDLKEQFSLLLLLLKTRQRHCRGANRFDSVTRCSQNCL